MPLRFKPPTLFLLLCCHASLAAPAAMNDYARGMTVDAAPGRPLTEMTLPDAVYRTVTRADLGDLRVFNASGSPVPHAFCTARDAPAPVMSKRALPVFELREAQRARGEGARIQVQTKSGTQVSVQDSASGLAEASGRIHIINARPIEEALRAIHFDWQSPDGASEAKVRIEASTDLDRWDVVVAASTLLVATQSTQELKRQRIELPQQEYEYLRVTRVDGGPPLLIHAVTAESVSIPADIEPFWFVPDAAGRGETGVFLFDTARLAPVRYARLRLPQENSSVRITLQSRADDASPWRARWSGEAYLIVSGTRRRESPPAKFEATTDRHWRVQVLNDAGLEAPGTLELGYRPARLRFLAQGSGPFTIAFGSRRTEGVPPTGCDGLLADVGAQDRLGLIGEGYAANPLTLGGAAALEPLPKKTPFRLIALWSVLIVGAALLIAMALALLKRLRAGG